FKFKASKFPSSAFICIFKKNKNSLIPRMNSKTAHLLIGPLLFLVFLYLPLPGLSPEGQAVLACTLWVAYWWVTEALELAVTALLPIIIFPLSGAVFIDKITSSYGHPFIFLFMGGFVLGIAIQKWD